MTWGLSGPHGCGKTTLAKAISEKSGVHFLEFNTTAICAEIGVSPVTELDISERLKVQEHILNRFWEISQAAPRPFISDRTPLDFAAYMLGEVRMGTARETNASLFDIPIDLFVDRCLRATSNTYIGVILLDRLPTYAVDPKRPAPSRSYQREFSALVKGLAFQAHNVNACHVFPDDFESRLTLAENTMEVVNAKFYRERANLVLC